MYTITQHLHSLSNSAVQIIQQVRKSVQYIHHLEGLHQHEGTCLLIIIDCDICD